MIFLAETEYLKYLENWKILSHKFIIIQHQARQDSGRVQRSSRELHSEDFTQGPSWNFFSSFCSVFFLELGWGVFLVYHHNLVTFNSWLYLPWGAAQRLHLIISTASYSLASKMHTTRSCLQSLAVTIILKSCYLGSIT